MRIATLRHGTAERVALVAGGYAYDLAGAARARGHAEIADSAAGLLEFIEAGPETWAKAEALYDDLRDLVPEPDGEGEWWWAADAARFAPPLIPSKDPWVLGANYYQHLVNGAARAPRPAIPPANPQFFTKAVTSIVGHDDDIVYDKRATVTVDYEGELTAVIGRRGVDLHTNDAYEHVFGYTIANDISARELQLGHKQFYRGKSLDGFCPLGPVIATRREIPDPNELHLRQWVNGELRQDWPVGDMLFKVDHTIAVLSQGLTIEPGDMLICGTVPGVGFERFPQIWLQHGDVIEVEISRIGRLRNTIRQAGS